MELLLEGGARHVQTFYYIIFRVREKTGFGKGGRQGAAFGPSALGFRPIHFRKG